MLICCPYIDPIFDMNIHNYNIFTYKLNNSEALMQYKKSIKIIITDDVYVEPYMM
jgi:hypothetical protein